MKYAVIKSGGKQYKVSEGEEILLDKLTLTKGETYVFPEVLLVRDGEKITIGSPFVADAKVSGKVLDQVKGDKVTIVKFKAKVHYRRRLGFRPLYTKIVIETISLSGSVTKKHKKGTPA
jgi:large subunit ribosomal protein L21